MSQWSAFAAAVHPAARLTPHSLLSQLLLLLLLQQSLHAVKAPRQS
jgi:hypothetical protein